MSVLHYDTGKIGIIAPHSGPRKIMACGRQLTGNQYSGRATRDKAKVTCKSCLKRMQEGNNND
jgi:hypothetical protein